MCSVALGVVAEDDRKHHLPEDFMYVHRIPNDMLKTLDVC